MSIVKLDLRAQNQCQQSQNACQKQVPAPLVKIDLTPEKQYERKSDHNNNSNYCSTNSTNSATSANTQGSTSCFVSHLSPTSSNVSLPPANQITTGSFSQIHNARAQPNSIANFMNSQFSMGSSPTQKSPSPVLISQNYNSTSPNHAQNQANQGTQSQIQFGSASNIPIHNPRNSIQQERKISQNSTEVSNDESAPNVVQLQLKLQQQVQENNELKELLLKEKSKTKMIITENLTMQEELRRAQQKLKEFEQLNQMRQSQALTQRASWMRTSPNKKGFGGIHSSNPRGAVGPTLKNNNNEFSADFSYDKYMSPMLEPQMSVPIHQNQLSQHSILDILHNLNGDEESFLTDRQNKDAGSRSDKLQSVKVSQFTKSKASNLNSQVRRRSNLTPSFSRFDTLNTIPKKIY